MKQRPSQRSIALTIAGSDSGGGAGIQADLKTFASLGVHGTSVITCVTAQNPAGVRGIQACRPELVKQQLEAVFDELKPQAIKTGMLYSEPLIRVVSRVLAQRLSVSLVVDPVMVATSGAHLLKPSAVRALCKELFTRATLVTPELGRSFLIARPIVAHARELRWAARELHNRFGCAALVKGGHLHNTTTAVDFYRDACDEFMIEAPRITGVSTHGTGCTLSAAIAGYLALGCGLPYAVEMAKNYVSNAIAQSIRVGRHMTLNHFWE